MNLKCMKKLHCTLTSLLYLFSVVVCFGQITVTFPADRVVFQRDNSNNAVVSIGGYFTECMDQVEARFVPIKSNPNKAELGNPSPLGGGWTVIKNTSTCGNFNGSMPVSGGWYRLEVRGIKSGKDPVVGTVQHVGVGEVFLIAGQSNATGGDNNPSGPGATEDAVSSVNFRNENNSTYSDFQLPCPEYVHLDQSTKTAPFGNYAWCWGSFGDQLVEKLNVPVMIYNAGWSATGIENWKQSMPVNAITTAWFGVDYPAGLPFGHLRIALNNYIAQCGIRAVLWHQGETDTFLNTTQDQYKNDLRSIIQESRSLSGKTNLPWIVARASRYSWVVTGDIDRSTHVSSNVIAAQNDVIGVGTHANDPAYKLEGVFEGPETDSYWSTDYRADSVHFKGPGLTFLAQLWTDRINDSFLSNSTPYPALPSPQITAVQASSNSMTFSAAAGWNTYNWLSQNDCNQIQATTSQWTAGIGLYKLKTTDSFNNSVFSPALYVSGNALPVTWKYFKVKADDKNAMLEWATTEEINASYFEVERGKDPYNFITIQRIAAAGNSKVIQEYNYHDYTQLEGTYYYRLKQVDYNGKYEYSRILSLNIHNKELISLFPNPVIDNLNIQSETSIYSVEVTNSLGIPLLSSSSQTNSFKLDMTKYQSGIYIVRVNGNSFKIIK